MEKEHLENKIKEIENICSKFRNNINMIEKLNKQDIVYDKEKESCYARMFISFYNTIAVKIDKRSKLCE